MDEQLIVFIGILWHCSVVNEHMFWSSCDGFFFLLYK